MNSTLRILVIGNVLAVFLCASAQAQLPRGGAAERERGLFNRMGARREERFNRNAPPPGSPLANPPGNGPAANQRAGALGNNPAAAARGGNAPANNAMPNQAGSSNGRIPQSAPPLNATVNSASANLARSNLAGQARNNPYSAGYGLAPNAQSEGNLSAGNLADRNLATGDAVRALPPNRLPYDGPGVLIRLPERLRGEVNYLIDDTEHFIVYSGEARLLRFKDRYEIRFSRGVKPDGQSFGEARYTVTEGVYRFDVTSTGWELYREGEARDVEVAVKQAEQQAARMQQASAELPVAPPGPAGPSGLDAQLDRESGVRPSNPRNQDSIERDALDLDLPSPAPKETASEDTLPAPRSILEPT